MTGFFSNRTQKLLVICILWVLLSVNVLLAQEAPATTLPQDFTEKLVIGDMHRPTSMAFAPDGRLFVAEQDGGLWIIENDVLVDPAFMYVSVNALGERGLLGVAFDPNFATNQYVYIYHTVSSPSIHNRVSRFTADGNAVIPGSEEVIYELDNVSAQNHNGGAIHFGPDGKLYIGSGDDYVGDNAQSLNNVFGKILRINKDGTIPTNNPFYNQTTGNNRAIWAYGLRNPFTFAFRPGSSRMFINDVGESTWEEINDGIAGSNYGWPITDGPSSNPNFRSPLFAYSHSGPSEQSGCAISGAAFYNPIDVQFPNDYLGDYFFGDFCSRWIRRYDVATNTALDFATNTTNRVVDIKVAPDGSVYYLARGDSVTQAGVYKIEYPQCQSVADPSPDNAAPRRNYFTSLPVTLSWNRTSWAQGYEIQVDNRVSFIGLEYRAEVAQDTLSVTIDNLNTCSYNWRVRAKINDTTWGPWSSTQQFLVDLP